MNIFTTFLSVLTIVVAARGYDGHPDLSQVRTEKCTLTKFSRDQEFFGQRIDTVSFSVEKNSEKTVWMEFSPVQGWKEEIHHPLKQLLVIPVEMYESSEYIELLGSNLLWEEKTIFRGSFKFQEAEFKIYGEWKNVSSAEPEPPYDFFVQIDNDKSVVRERQFHFACSHYNDGYVEKEYRRTGAGKLKTP